MSIMVLSSLTSETIRTISTLTMLVIYHFLKTIPALVFLQLKNRNGEFFLPHASYKFVLLSFGSPSGMKIFLKAWIRITKLFALFRKKCFTIMFRLTFAG